MPCPVLDRVFNFLLMFINIQLAITLIASLFSYRKDNKHNSQSRQKKEKRKSKKKDKHWTLFNNWKMARCFFLLNILLHWKIYGYFQCKQQHKPMWDQSLTSFFESSLQYIKSTKQLTTDWLIFEIKHEVYLSILLTFVMLPYFILELQNKLLHYWLRKEDSSTKGAWFPFST